MGSHPIGFHADEASIGYDAYSILKTGRDQYGEFLPLFARSFGDYDEALHRYLVVPFVAVLGLNEWAVRLPNALLGILTVWAFYGMVQVWFDRRVALVAALFLAISPWHIQFSRWGIRIILLPLLCCWGMHLFLKGMKNPRYLIGCALIFGVGLHTYQAARVFVPLFVLGLAALHWRVLWQHRGMAALSGGIFLAIFGYLFSFWIAPEGMARAQSELETHPLSILIYYLSYFSPGFLFFSGDPNLRHSLIGMGQLHHFELMTVLCGIWGLWRKGGGDGRIVWLWLLLYPIPAALTDMSHSVRAIAGVPVLALLSGYGCCVVADWLGTERERRIFWQGTVLVAAVSVLVYCKLFYVDYPNYSAKWWQYGMQEAIAVAEQQEHPVIISDRTYSFPAYIFVLFYTRFDPEAYQKLPLDLRQELWRYTRTPLQKYYNLGLQTFVSRGRTCLLMLLPEEMVDLVQKGYDQKDVHTIYDPSGKVMMRLVEVTGDR
ncbi:MAG: glycosyltransferase family 39 protein [bacterium]|nr:glycosyltransferase family 39 protein [bacterium]